MDIIFKISLAILLLSGVCCGAWNLRIHFKRLPKAPVLNPINVFSAFVFVAFLMLFVPNAIEEFESVSLAVFSALFDTMDSLSFGNRIEDMFGRFFEKVAETEIRPWHTFYACAVTLLVPVLAMRAVFSVFRDWFTQLRFKADFKNSFHIFSELNSKSITLAKDIVKKEKNAKIIFTSADKKTTESLYLEQARRINALLTNKTINGFKTESLFSNQKLYLYFIGEDRKKNIKLALDKFEEIKNTTRETRVYVFSVDNTAERVVDIVNQRNENKEIRMVLFNEAQRTAYNILNEHPIYDLCSKNESINIMILGAGHIGSELAKAISWCSQMISCKFSIKVFDKDKKNEQLGFPFVGLSEKLSKIGTKLDIEFLNCDIFSAGFNEQRFETVDYIVIDVGDDSSNLAAALQMREIYLREKTANGFTLSKHDAPRIITIIEDEETKKIVEALEDMAIIPYGTVSDVFNLDNVVNWKIDKAGEFLHACYYSFINLKSNSKADDLVLLNEGIEKYATETELNKRSSRAVAVHGNYKAHDIEVYKRKNHIDKDSLCLVDEKAYNEQMERLQYKLYRCEHDRWNVFQILDGWEPWDENKLTNNGIHKQKNAKLHAYIAKFNNLKEIANTVHQGKENPIEFDMVMVMSSELAAEYAESGKVNKEKLRALFDKFREQIKKGG